MTQREMQTLARQLQGSDPADGKQINTRTVSGTPVLPVVFGGPDMKLEGYSQNYRDQLATQKDIDFLEDYWSDRADTPSLQNLYQSIYQGVNDINKQNTLTPRQLMSIRAKLYNNIKSQLENYAPYRYLQVIEAARLKALKNALLEGRYLTNNPPEERKSFIPPMLNTPQWLPTNAQRNAGMNIQY